MRKVVLRMPSITSTNEQDVRFHFQRVAFHYSMLVCMCVCVHGGVAMGVSEAVRDCVYLSKFMSKCPGEEQGKQSAYF